MPDIDPKVRKLAKSLADGAIEDIEFMSAVEIAEDMELDLDEDQVDLAFRLAIRATVTLPNTL